MNQPTQQLSRIFTQFSGNTPTDASTRLRATLAAGTSPRISDIPALITQCAIEPDFFVRDMLTWALTRQPMDSAVPLLLSELESPVPQAVSQALHTLSKIGDARAYPHITTAHLSSHDANVSLAAWRAAVNLVPIDQCPALAEHLASQLERGDREMRRSLSRAFLNLAAVETKATTTTVDTLSKESPQESPGEAVVRVLESKRGNHARATLLMLTNSELSFDTAEYHAEHT